MPAPKAPFETPGEPNDASDRNGVFARGGGAQLKRGGRAMRRRPTGLRRSLPSLGKDDIERVRALLYRSVGDLDLWPEALRAVAGTVGATGVVMSMPSRDPSVGFSFDQLALNVDLDAALKYSALSGTLDPWSEGALRRGYARPGFVLRGGEMCDRQDVERSSWKSQVIEPAAIGDVLTAMIEAPPEAPFGFSIAVFHRHRPCEPYEPEVVERLRIFTEDLSRSTKAVFSLRAARQHAALLQSALDQVAEAIIVLNNGRFVEFHNGTACELLNRGEMLAVRGRRLIARRQSDNRRLQRAIYEASQNRAGSNLSFLRENRPPLTATVVPFAQKGDDILHGMPSGVIVIVTGTDQAVADIDAIRSMLPFTPAEARLAQALAENRSLPQAAAAFGVSVETVRTQLKSIFGKLNVSKQADVSQLVQRLPKSR